MNSSFGGTARQRPRVNLGGTRREVSKDELLRRAAFDRQQREVFRRQTLAAQTIQKCWAIKRARLAALDLLRHDFDVLWPDFISQLSLTQQLKTALIGRPVFALYRCFFNARRDKSRTIKIAEFVISNTLEESDLCAEQLAQFIAPCFTKTLLRLMSGWEERVSTYKDYLQCSQMMVTALRRSMLWSKPTGTIFESASYCRDHYKLMAEELKRSSSTQSASAFILDVYGCIILPLQLSGKMEQPYYAFCSYILAYNDLPRHQQLCSEIATLDLQSLLPCMNHIFKDEKVLNDVTAWEMRLWALVQLSSGPMSQIFEVRDSWIETVCNILNYVRRQESDPDEMVDKRQSASEQTVELVRMDTMDKLTNNSMLSCLLLPSAASKLYEFFGCLLVHYPRQRDTLLLNLSLFATDQSAPYNLLDVCYGRWIRSAHRPDGLSTRKFSPEGTFYLELLSRVLLTMVDDEFFDAKRRSFDLDMIVGTAQQLKELAYPLAAYDLAGNLFEKPYTMPCKYGQELVARVLQQIQTRDLRRPFLPQNFWLDTRNLPKLSAQYALEAFQEIEDEPEEEQENQINRKWSGSSMVRVLNNFPYLFPFEARIASLQAVIRNDVTANGYDNYWRSAGKHHVECRREHEFEDGMRSLWQAGGGIKGPLSVDYRDVYGLQEAGIDGGGLTKEFLTSVCMQAISPEFGLFVETPSRLLYPSPTAVARTAPRLQQYQFLGRVIARCIYSGILLDVAFAPFFLLRWIDRLSYIDDLQGLDQELYNGLLKLKNYPGDVENDFALDFTVNEVDGETTRTINLLPDGASKSVTRQNRLQYIHLVCHYKLHRSISRQAQAFVDGMSEVLDMRWLSMFDSAELQALVGGAPVAIDMDDLRKNTVYGGYEEQDVTVKLFWDVVKDFSNEEKRKLLKFVTSTPRPPLLGFKELNPKFSLRWAGRDTDRLPTASTCVNLLKLPAYVNYQQMQEKLKLSINAEAGFDLS